MDEKKLVDSFDKINNAKRILLTTHERPDGDAISSICILIELLNNLNKNFLAFSQDAVPNQYNFLAHSGEITADKMNVGFFNFDLIISLDCGSISRTGFSEEIKNRRADQVFIEFDHHPKIEDWADIENRCPSCASTTEVLYYFLKANNIPLNRNYANSILTGLLTDTGNFLFPVTSDKSISIASEMLLLGAKFPAIMESTWRNKSLGAMKLWGHVLSNIKLNKKYNFAFSIIKKEDIIENNVSDEELENLSNFISNLHGVKAIMLLQEIGQREIKGSFRTADPNMDVSKLARKLGGGGHEKAAGFKIKGLLIKQNEKWKVV